MNIEKSNITLFEVSWEVCNKVGGIYSVVSSKALQAYENFGEDYYLLGPDLKTNAEFTECTDNDWDTIKQALAVKNLKCRVGRWEIPGRPKVILVSFTGRYNPEQLFFELWNKFGLDSLSGSWDYIEPVLFSTACAEVIETIYQSTVLPLHGKAVAHFHEWMCGGGLLYLKKNLPEVATVFTTHATILGRSMAGAGVDIYRQMKNISPQQEATAYHITAKWSMESICAREADCFTTVSGITAEEAKTLLGRTPDVLTLNGLDMRVIPDFTQERALAHQRKLDVLAKAGVLLRKEFAEDSKMIVISGRYEYHNKGIDCFLEALAKLNQNMHSDEPYVLAICSVMGGHNGINPAAISGNKDIQSDQGANWYSSHYIWDQSNDPILCACKRLGLNNSQKDKIQVIFLPVQLDGHDGFMNMHYYDLLSACDLGVFPSWYEPWGYTPQESAAYAVPTVTTDLSGFGLWARELQTERSGLAGVTVLPRRQSTYDETVNSLASVIADTISSNEEIKDARRRAVYSLANECSWENFFPYYIEAYRFAIGKAITQFAKGEGARKSERLTQVLNSNPSHAPHLHQIFAIAELPEKFERLRELANNIWWSWNPDAWKLFEALMPETWFGIDHNPILAIEQTSPEHYAHLAANEDYIRMYNKVMQEFDDYMSDDKSKIETNIITQTNPIAYFSTEYGLHESLTIYSGGLGVLSGDHLKSSSDLNIPLIAIGLLYKNGYFRQRIDENGRQIPIYPENNFSNLPVERVLNEQGNVVEIELDLPGRKLFAQTWRVKVGRITLYLLDTDIPKNSVDDRKVTARLYESDRDFRLRQEILLGMGGVRLLKSLEIEPSCFHMNEGHSAFLNLERIRSSMFEYSMSFQEASILVRSNTVFTTHTPVDAGNERFSLELMERYFTEYAHSVGLSIQQFFALGRVTGDERPVFEMTVLALHLAHKANGVSQLHGAVSRRMWGALWTGLPTVEIPISHVTNGIHVPSYVGKAMRKLLSQSVGHNFLELEAKDPAWQNVYKINDNDFWEARLSQKEELLQYVRSSLPAFFQKFDVPRALQRASLAKLNNKALVIGFARRFAPYKRATLLLADPERLKRILGDPERPVVLIFSGKSHPADEEGIKLIQQIIKICKEPDFIGKIFFVEDYSLAISRLLTQGCDVWLNTPRRPYEASGTSGQKVPVNGGINLSISDGWWCEGQGVNNGWTIGPRVLEVLPSAAQNDYADAESLYTLLEETVIPSYYTRDNNNLPKSWIDTAKESMKTLTAMYSSHRMVRNYVEQLYIPSALHGKTMYANHQENTRHISSWKQDINARFGAIKIKEVLVGGLEQNNLSCASPMAVQVTIDLGSLEPSELNVQLIVGASDGVEFIKVPTKIRLTPKVNVDGDTVYSGTYLGCDSGQYAYGIRINPTTKGILGKTINIPRIWL